MWKEPFSLSCVTRPDILFLTERVSFEGVIWMLHNNQKHWIQLCLTIETSQCFDRLVCLANWNNSFKECCVYRINYVDPHKTLNTHILWYFPKMKISHTNINNCCMRLDALILYLLTSFCILCKLILHHVHSPKCIVTHANTLFYNKTMDFFPVSYRQNPSRLTKLTVIIQFGWWV